MPACSYHQANVMTVSRGNARDITWRSTRRVPLALSWAGIHRRTPEQVGRLGFSKQQRVWTDPRLSTRRIGGVAEEVAPGSIITAASRSVWYCGPQAPARSLQSSVLRIRSAVLGFAYQLDDSALPTPSNVSVITGKHKKRTRSRHQAAVRAIGSV